MADDRQQRNDKTERTPFSESELARRHDRLSRALDQEKQERLRAAATHPAGRPSYAVALRLASEFVAGVLVGAAIGWGIDQVAGTSPWGLIVFLLLGFAAGTLNVVRAGGGLSTSGSGDRDNGGAGDGAPR